tara:strand:+ start:18977 stop:19366 length:390 start_codon:yes stop_codon:yes gene_type:complete
MKSDSQIQADVLEQLNWDPNISHGHIGVSILNGIVTLSGRVPSFIEKLASEKATQRVGGVKAVVEKIEDALKREAKNEANHIKVEVSGDKVTLRGDVKSFADMDNAKWAAWSAPGVSTVENKLQVNPLH